jgi:hypothetical protein
LSGGTVATVVLTASLLTLLPFDRASAQVAAGKKMGTSSTAVSRGYDYEHPEAQPSGETLDLAMYSRIREEGLDHSHVMVRA